MLPLQDLFSQLDEALNINSSDSVFTDLYYTDLINEQRSVWIRNEYNKNRSIDPNIQQTIGDLELELVDPVACCVTIPGTCKLLRSKVKLPNTIEFYNWKGITSVGPVDISQKRFTMIDYARVPYIGSGRITKRNVYAFLYEQYIYVVSADPAILTLRHINVRGLFEDPTAIGEFCTCTGVPCWNPEIDKYPMNLWMWAYIKNILVQMLLQKKTLPLDESNDNKDEVLNGGQQ